MLRLRDCLNCLTISFEDYVEIIQGLFKVSPTDRLAHLITKYDSRGAPVAIATVSRNFGEGVLVAEDRGPEYAVWFLKRSRHSGSFTVLGFFQIPWGEIQPPEAD